MPAIRKTIFKTLSHKYRLVFFNDQTFEEIWHLRLSPLNVMSLIGTLSLLATALILVVLLFTPLREFLPGYPNEEARRSIYAQMYTLDSLELEVRNRNDYLTALLRVISEEDTITTAQPQVRDSLVYKKIEFRKSAEDSLFRKQIEVEERFNVALSVSGEGENLSRLYFFPPIKGLLINKFDKAQCHLGVDLVAAPNEMVKSVLDGTVVMASWTLDTGYVIMIQHNNNILTVYKHNARLLGRIGNRVRAGEVIAIVGNSGEETTGPHLHFELWENGVAVDPEDYIQF